jgi:caspase domain-containing protein
MAGAKRGVSRGLSRIEPEDNTLVVYAAKDGTTADDGTGRRHSPFTAALLKHIATPGLEVSFVFRRVRDDVVAATKTLQTPHTYGTLGGAELYLKPLPVVPPPPPPAPSVPATTDKDLADLKAQVDALKAALAAKETAPSGPAVNEDVTKLKDQITSPQTQLKRPETATTPRTVTAPPAPKTSTQRPPSDLTAYSLRFWPKGSLKIGQVVSQVTPYGRLVCQSTGPGTRPCRLEK